MSRTIDEIETITSGGASPVVTYHPVVLDVPGRAVPLALKVSAPANGTDLPVLLLSHGHGASVFLSSLHGYGPLSNYFASEGFVVLQPTHLDSGTLGLREADDPDAPLYARSRAADMRYLVDHLGDIESTVPGLAGRVDHDRIAAAGHSLGGHTTCMLLGMGAQDPATGETLDARIDRVRAGVVLAAPGNGDLADWAAENYPWLRVCDFSTMTTDALVVAGDEDLNPMFSDRLSYRWDSYTQSPGPKSLLMLHGAEHMLGGVSGYDADETTDEDPQRVALLRSVAVAYLRSVLYPGDRSWNDAVAGLASEPTATVEEK
ncbi:chlorophyllase [Phycicoccus sp. BSK3Z-2]|uniref:Chlorophyllase n=1 Tax=Phycicoccus avicenniae TaxID=2828860 RepID=A0A941D4A9_9MICO|nr:chlorophyllase [Phycicoccus avicenniae]MBR7741849.1 chlorophyllase [Phycicoccus avicenniae]